jgi:hypothetical protein
MAGSNKVYTATFQGEDGKTTTKNVIAVNCQGAARKAAEEPPDASELVSVAFNKEFVI